MVDSILLTGFEPFLNYDYNPSGSIAKKLDGKLISGRKIVGKVLPVKHRESSQILRSYVEECKPKAIIATGLKATIGCIALERVALNHYYFRNEHEEIDGPLDKNGVAAYFSTLPVKEIKEKVQNANIPAEFSFFPDTYVSNEVFYEVMKLATKLKIKRSGFIHLPLTHEQVVKMRQAHYAIRATIPSLSDLEIEKALRIAVETTLLLL